MLKAIFDSIKYVVLLSGFKVDVVEFEVVCSLSYSCGEDLISGDSVTAIPPILLLFVVVCRPDHRHGLGFDGVACLVHGAARFA